MGSSSSKYMVPHANVDYSGSISHGRPGEGEGKDVCPLHDSELKSTRECGNGKVWGHNLLADEQSNINQPAGKPPYHDDYEQVIAVYTEDILPIEDPASMHPQDVPTIDLPPTPPRSKARATEGRHRAGAADVHGLPPRSPKQAFVATKKKKGAARSPLRSIEDIRVAQHERIMEQMRKYESHAPPPPPPAVQVTQSATDASTALQLINALRQEDESLEQVPMKPVASEQGSKKSSLKGMPQAWTKPAKSASDARSRIAAAVSATLTRAGRAEKASAAKRPETQRASSASGPESSKAATQAAAAVAKGGSEHGVTGGDKTNILDLEIF